jgi:hypothetical protein
MMNDELKGENAKCRGLRWAGSRDICELLFLLWLPLVTKVQGLGINLACIEHSIEPTIIVFVFLSVTLTALVMEDRKVAYKDYY